MTFEDESFRSIIDKGTLDALLPDIKHVAVAKSMLDESWRVLSGMGSYIIVSLAQDHVLKTLVSHFQSRSVCYLFLIAVFVEYVSLPCVPLPCVSLSYVSLAVPSILFILLLFRACVFRVHKLPAGEKDSFVMPVFAFVITKLRQIPGVKPVSDHTAEH